MLQGRPSSESATASAQRDAQKDTKSAEVREDTKMPGAWSTRAIVEALEKERTQLGQRVGEAQARLSEMGLKARDSRGHA
jgi:hypothetical protein